MELPDAALEWLLAGDVAVQYQTRRDLLGDEQPRLRARIALEGLGAALLDARGPDGHWGRGFYQPKWTSSHYTLLELKNLAVPPDTPAARETVDLILRTEVGSDGGLDPSRTSRSSDVCINGMALGYASYFGAEPERLAGIVDYVLGQQLGDGGFNCRLQRRPGTRHSSVHSSVSVLEGLADYVRAGYRHRRDQAWQVVEDVAEFFLRHRLFRTERDGRPMRPEFTRLHHPTRWHFDVLRGLDAFRDADLGADPRLEDALAVIRSRRGADGRWRAAARYRGATHVRSDHVDADRWVTLGALRVLRRYDGSGPPPARV